MIPSIVGIIPARYASSRFPGKPLALLAGRPMIVHVCERVAEAHTLEAFWVATDDERIAEAVRAAGYEARMTSPDCPSGTDRIAASLGEDDYYDIIINIQGDEPRLDPSVVDAVAQALAEAPDCGVSTAAVALRDGEAFASPHVVKVVTSPQGRALYFSRAPIPSLARLAPEATSAEGFVFGLKHLGIYGYRREVLAQCAAWQPTPLEKRECLEQLRFMEHGVAIQVAVVAHDSIGVDTPEELEMLNIQLKTSSN